MDIIKVCTVCESNRREMNIVTPEQRSKPTTKYAENLLVFASLKTCCFIEFYKD